MTATSIPTNIQEEAANWIVRLTYGTPAERHLAQTGFAEWKNKDPVNAAAAESMQQVISCITAVKDVSKGEKSPIQAAIQAGHASSQGKRRKQLVATLLLAFSLSVPAWVALQTYPVRYLAADVRSVTGEWRTQTLSDGSRITLKNATAIDIKFDSERRTLKLVKGEILVDVAPDKTRPFLVETNDGDIRALGTRFVVDRKTDETVVSMLESSVSVRTAEQRKLNTQSNAVIHAGQRIRIQPDALGNIEEMDAVSLENAWQNHQLVAYNRPLTEILDEINRHRPGKIFYDRKALAGIEMGAVLPLDDTDQALQLLANSLPNLRVRKLTPYLVQVDLHADTKK